MFHYLGFGYWPILSTVGSLFNHIFCNIVQNNRKVGQCYTLSASPQFFQIPSCQYETQDVCLLAALCRVDVEGEAVSIQCAVKLSQDKRRSSGYQEGKTVTASTSLSRPETCCFDISVTHSQPCKHILRVNELDTLWRFLASVLLLLCT